MKTLKKILGLSLVYMILGTTQGFATSFLSQSTVYFHFRHVPATVGKEPGNAVLRVKAFITDMHKAESINLLLGQFSPDHMNGGIYPGEEISLLFICTHGSISTIKVSETHLDSTESREVDINASCPVDEQGSPLEPSDISITQK